MVAHRLTRLRAAVLAPRRLLRAAAARWLPRRTVRLRLTLLYGSLFVLAGAALLTITYVLVASTLTSTVTATTSVGGGGRQIVVRVSSVGAGAVLALPSPGGPAVGPVIASGSGSGADPAPNVALQAQGAIVQSKGRLPAGATANPGVFVKEALDHQRSGELGQLLLWSGTALGIMALASVALGWWIAGRALAPLRRMTASAREISAENLYERLSLDGPDDELKELGDTFDGLLTRLEGAFEAQRRFVANASHELRTPLTLQRATIEVALADPDADTASLQAAFRRVLVAGEQQEHLIEALLTLARSERGLDRREPVDLAAEVRLAMAAVREAHPAAAGGGVRMPRITAALEPATLAGDRRLIERFAVNLLDNAVRHNVADGWIEVVTETVQRRPTLRVTNSGPVLAPEDLPGLLEPFRRAAPLRAGHGSGQGLGLSIAAAIATAHGAELSVSARVKGGLEVEARFPAVATFGASAAVGAVAGLSLVPVASAAVAAGGAVAGTAARNR